MLKALPLFVLFALALGGTPAGAGAQQAIDTAGVAKALGRGGTAMSDGVYRVAFPRTDLHVVIGGVHVAPGLALGSYAAFKAEPQGALAMGDLVLLEDEIQPVMESLLSSGVQITALHNHLRGEEPHVMYMHFMATGDAVAIAGSLHKALALTRTPTGAAKPPDTSTPWFAEVVQQTLGRTGKSANGVLAISAARKEDVTMQGMSVPPAMGVSTAVNFQSAGDNRVAATGDFVLSAGEVSAVERTLTSHGIEVTALHSHMIGDTPPLYFMHFWGVGAPNAIAAALKDALSQAGVEEPAG